jgi:pimeloyl-ACP methyl ester carboxylesterase
MKATAIAGLALLLAACLSAAPAGDAPPAATPSATVVSARQGPNGAPMVAIPSGVTGEPIGTYDVARLNRILTTELPDAGFGVPGQVRYEPATTAVRLYRMTYPSVVPEQHNRPTVATGLVAIPEKRVPGTPIVCYQHGTVFSKDEVPSNPEQSIETRLMVAQFAGHGYVVVAADYFGKGGSAEGDSYLVKASTQQACVDMLFTAKALLGAMGIAPGPLFLSGWSQGGWATLVLLQHLESLGAPVAAAATASAPCDVYTTVSRWINNPQPIDTPWLTGVCALQLNAQERYLQPGLVDVAIKPEYAQACRDLYANRIGWPEFGARVPKLVRDMLRPEFVATSAMGESDYWQRLRAAQGYSWRCRTPLHVYWGAKDEVTPPYIATLPEGFQRIVAGAPTEAICAGPEADHRGTFLFAVGDQKKWFDALLTGMTGAK